MDPTTSSENTTMFSPSPRRRNNTGGSCESFVTLPSPRRTPLRALPRNNNSITDMSTLVEASEQQHPFKIATPSPQKAMTKLTTPLKTPSTTIFGISRTPKGTPGKTPNTGKLLSPLPLQPRKLGTATKKKITIDMDDFLSNQEQPAAIATDDDYTGGYLGEAASIEEQEECGYGDLKISPAFDEDSMEGGAYALEDFKCIRKLGSGGTAEVYEVLELSSCAMYALKVQKSTEDALCELDLHIPLRHKNICQMVDYFYSDTKPFADLVTYDVPTKHQQFEPEGDKDTTYLCTILELCDGGDMHTVIDEHVTMPENLAAKYILEAIDALQYIHSTGTIHCDIKPANWLVDGKDDDAVVKLADFGMAVTNTAKEIVGGSPVYMAPEHLLAWRDMTDNFDHRTDIYSLGVVLYEMLLGYLPYEVLEAEPKGNQTEEENDDCVDSIANEIKGLSVDEDRDDQETTDFGYPVLDLRKLNDASSDEPFYIPPPIFVEEISEEAQDLILCLMEPSASKRITLEEAKEHKWFAKCLSL